MMFGFSFGLVMLMFVVFFPVAYLVSYAATSFDAWRLGKEIPKHKIKINIILSVIIGIVFGGIFQYFWDELSMCMQAGNDIGKCILKLNSK